MSVEAHPPKGCGHGPLEGTTVMRWSDIPEERAWMLENAGSRPLSEVIEGFEARFGVRLRPTQVSAFRSAYGLKRRTFGSHKRDRLQPVGTEYPGKDGYTMVKVAMHPSAPGRKDNWVLKQRWVWEQANGRPVPDGCAVMFADHDTSNFDPDNLVAVPRNMMARLNSLECGWSDRETLLACVALVDLDHAVFEAENYAPRRCGVCGVEFVPDRRDRGFPNRKTCKACLALGRKTRGERCGGETGVCVACGREFRKNTHRQRKCHECSVKNRRAKR